MATREFAVLRDVTVRVGEGTSYDEEHLLIGMGQYRYRAFLRFGSTWTGVGQIISAELRWRNTAGVHWAHGSAPRIRVRVLKESFTEDMAEAEGEEDYSADEQDPVVFTSPSVQAEVDGDLDAFVSVDITNLVEMWAPNTVAKRDGQPGKGLEPFGLRLSADSETDTSRRLEIWSRHAPVVGDRPYILLTYDPSPTAPDAPTDLEPSGAIADPPTEFTGTFNDPNATSKLARTEVRLFHVGGDEPIWQSVATATESQRTSGVFGVPLPEDQVIVRRGVSYEWTARTQDDSGRWGAFAPRVSFTADNTPPILILGNFVSLDSLSHVFFRGTALDADPGDSIGRYRIQLRPQTAPGDPSWDTGNLWDTGWVAVETTTLPWGVDRFRTRYGGQPLLAGDYTWRAQVEDLNGGLSDWEYDDFTLTTDFDPTPGAGEFLTGYNNLGKTRVLIYAMDETTRGPTGAPIAIIEDASNLGAARYMNAPGEMFMTLPATHPQIGVVEPWRVHYAVQIWNGDRYVNKFFGIVTDFDATEDDVVMYGIDYLALLGLVVDTRFDAEAPDKPFSQGGSKYVSETISGIIGDLLSIARNKANSPVNFISVGSLDVMSEETTIYTTFAQMLGIITGLVASHRQGTGKSSQIVVREKAAGGFEFRLLDDPGVERDNIRLEYGGLIQGFRLIGFGDFATVTHGVGRVRNGFTIFYRTKTADGIDLGGANGYGRIETVRLYEQVNDSNDLERRVRQDSASNARIGKRIAMGLRVDALMPFDGYDIGDHVPVLIQRGVVDTTNYGAGYWTIVGVEWRIYPDGHTDLTLVVLPREDASEPDPDIITSSEVLAGREWEVGYGAPTAGVNTAQHYADLDTGITYDLQTDATYVEAAHPMEQESPAGWRQAVESGAFNASLVAPPGPLAVSETGSADTVPEYLASLTDDLPFWVIEEIDAGSTLEIVANAAAPDGTELRFERTSGTPSAVAYQDIPVTAAHRYTAQILDHLGVLHKQTLPETPALAKFVRFGVGFAYTGAGTPYALGVAYSFRDADHAVIGAPAFDDMELYATGPIGVWAIALAHDNEHVDNLTVAPNGVVQLEAGANLTLADGTIDVSDGLGGGGQISPVIGGGLQLSPIILTDEITLRDVVDINTGGTNDNQRHFNVNRAIAMSSVVTLADLTADVNDYAPGDIARGSYMWRQGSDATPRTITGINNNQSQGEEHLLVNINTATDIVLAHEDAGSAAQFRFICPGGVDFTLQAGAAVRIVYDDVSDRWRLVAA